VGLDVSVGESLLVVFSCLYALCVRFYLTGNLPLFCPRE